MDPAHRPPVDDSYTKLFVSDLPATVTSDDLREYFSKFGELGEVTVKHGGEARAHYGFVWTVSQSTAMAIMSTSHTIGDQTIPAPVLARNRRRAATGGRKWESAQPADPRCSPDKIFVGGLSNDTTPEDYRVPPSPRPRRVNASSSVCFAPQASLLAGICPRPSVCTHACWQAYFEKFGTIKDAIIMRDRATNRSRGFGFVTFVDSASVTAVLAEQYHELDGRKVEVKPALPKEFLADDDSTSAAGTLYGRAYNEPGYMETAMGYMPHLGMPFAGMMPPGGGPPLPQNSGPTTQGVRVTEEGEEKREVSRPRETSRPNTQQRPRQGLRSHLDPPCSGCGQRPALQFDGGHVSERQGRAASGPCACSRFLPGWAVERGRHARNGRHVQHACAQLRADAAAQLRCLPTAACAWDGADAGRSADHGNDADDGRTAPCYDGRDAGGRTCGVRAQRSSGPLPKPDRLHDAAPQGSERRQALLRRGFCNADQTL